MIERGEVTIQFKFPEPIEAAGVLERQGYGRGIMRFEVTGAEVTINTEGGILLRWRGNAIGDGEERLFSSIDPLLNDFARAIFDDVLVVVGMSQAQIWHRERQLSMSLTKKLRQR